MTSSAPVTKPRETYQSIVSRLQAAADEGGEGSRSNTRIARRILWLCRQANWPPETTAASRRDVIDFFERNRPATFGLQPGSYAVYKSEILSQIKSDQTIRRQHIAQMSGVYREIYDRTLDCSSIPQSLRWRCTAFLRYLSRRDIHPSSVSDETVMAYYRFNLEVAEVSEMHARTRAKAAAKYISLLSGHPDFKEFGLSNVQADLPRRHVKYNVPQEISSAILKEFDERIAPWARGEASNLGETWNAYIARLDADDTSDANSEKKRTWRATRTHQIRIARSVHTSKGSARGFLPESRRWKPGTIKTRRDICATCAKLLYETEGYKLESIEELTDPEILEAIAIGLTARAATRNPQSSYINHIIGFAAMLARDFVQRPSLDLDIISQIKERYTTRRRGIAQKNRDILAQFTKERIQALIDMPDAILRDVNRQVLQRRHAHRTAEGQLPRAVDVYDAPLIQKVMLALAAHIMLARAPRKSNLAEMRLDWLRWRDGLVTIEIPAPSVKSRDARDGPLLIPLDSNASGLMDRYLKQLRPKLLDEYDNRNPFVFPALRRCGKSRDSRFLASLPERLVREVHERVGVRINPHLWRHLLGLIWLRENPDKLPAVQKLLGHKRIQTTIEYYAEVDETIVLAEWMEFLDGKRKKS